MKNKHSKGLIWVLAGVVVVAAAVIVAMGIHRSQPLTEKKIDTLRSEYPQYTTTIIDTIGDCEKLADMPKLLPGVSLVRVTRIAGDVTSGGDDTMLVPVRVDEVLYRSTASGVALSDDVTAGTQCKLAVADAARFPEGSYVLAVRQFSTTDVRLSADTRGGMYVTDSGHLLTMDATAELYLQPYNGSTLRQLRAAIKKELSTTK